MPRSVRTLLLLVLSTYTLSAGTVTMTVLPTLGPDINASPVNFDTWTANVIAALKIGASQYGDSSLPTYYQQQSHGTYAETVTTDFHSWRGDVSPTGAFAAQHGNRITFSAIIDGGGDLFTMSSISYATVGAGNSFLDYDWAGFPLSTEFGPSIVGVVYGSGPTPTYITSGSFANTPVNEVLLRGRGFPANVSCWLCTTSAEYEAAMDSFVHNHLYGMTSYTMNMTVDLVGGSQVIGRGTFTFDDAVATPEPAAFALLATAIPLLVWRRRKVAR